MTAKEYAELAPLMNRTALYPANSEFQAEVITTDVRKIYRYDRVDVKITPVAGKGEKWVSKDSLLFVEEPTVTETVGA